MDSKELIRAGKLSEAREAVIDEVKSSPADIGKRTLLFQIQSLYGEWDKAERQLDIIVSQDQKRETGIQVYKNIINAEKSRIDFLKENQRPSFLPKAPAYAEKYFLACEKLKSNQFDEALELFNEIDDQIPEISGTLNGKKFSGIRDTDIFTSLFLEAIVHEKYVWIPFEMIRELSISLPETLLDLIWISATVTSMEGLTLNSYLPVLYANSFTHEDPRVKLGRMTDWTSIGGPFSKASGQHVFQVGEEDVSILEMREVIFNPHISKESN